MGRKTGFNKNLTENYDKINPQNKELVEEFIRYCYAMDKSKATMNTYTNQLKIFMCWNYEYNHDKFFIDLKSKDFVSFIGYLRGTLNSSSNRINSFRSLISSFSNCIERQYEDEYPQFRNRIKNLDRTPKQPKLEKTIISEDQLQQMLDELVAKKKYQLACWLALLASSGSRRSEGLQMKVNFFDDKHIVFDGLMYKTDTMRSKGAGSEGKKIQRYIMKKDFDPYLNLWLEERKRLGIDSEYLFVVKYDGGYRPAQKSTADAWATQISKEFNIKFYNHCMRHYFTTKMKRSNYPNEIIVKVIQWSSTDMIKVYNDVSDDETLENYFKNLNKDEN